MAGLSALLALGSFSTRTLAAGEGDDYPDTLSTATPVSCGTIYEGAIGDDEDVDVLSFTTDTSTSAYTINVTAVDDMPLSIRVYSESSPNVIDGGSFSVASARTMAKSYAQLERGKKYWIQIAGSGYYDSGRWRVLISKIADDAGNDFKNEKKISVGKTVNGKFEVNLDTDFYTFKTPKGAKSYWIDFHNKTGASQMNFVLYAVPNDLSSKVGTEGQVYAANTYETTYKLNPNKTYYLRVYGGAEDSTYSFKLNQSAKTIKKQKPGSFKVGSNYSRSVYVSWENNRRYDGVELYRSTNPKSGFKKIKVIENEYYDYDDNKTAKKVKYYYKARYFVKEGKNKVYSKFTAIKSGSHRY